MAVFPVFMLSTAGRSSPSFLIAVVVLVLGALAYFGWSFVRPNPHALSETVVREFARDVGREVATFRREARALARKDFKDPERQEAALASIDDKAEKAIRRVEEQADEARAGLADLDIAIRTQRNRFSRLETREDEAREMISAVAEDVKARIRGEE